jgi:hypothetical protein
MVGLDVYTGPRPCQKGFPAGSRLRDFGVWYPTIPARSLCLNEESYPPLYSHIIGYRPLFWCHFGGPGGDLPHLTGLSTISSDRSIHRFHFHFDKEVPAEQQAFGLLKESEAKDDIVHFPIDGYGGERIETITIRYDRSAGPTNPPLVIRCEVCHVSSAYLSMI